MILRKGWRKIKSLVPSKRDGSTYQDNRFPEDQYQLIKKSISDHDNLVKNFFEVGCNQGKLINFLAEDGYFTTGVDVEKNMPKKLTGKALKGAYGINLENVDYLPIFDCILLLSVHHQWIKNNGDKHASELIKKLYSKTDKYLFIEFAAIARKYGYKKNEYFIDNKEESIVQYAKSWIEKNEISTKIIYLGKTRELPPIEPYRFMFRCEK